jgi:hypothetical protein
MQFRSGRAARAAAVSISAIAAFAAATVVHAATAPQAPDTVRADERAQGVLDRVLSSVPVWFEENRGQLADPAARFRARGADGSSTTLAGDRVVVEFPIAALPEVSTTAVEPAEALTGASDAPSMLLAEPARTEPRRLVWHWIGADADATATAGEPTRLVMNYYTGNDPSRWVQGLPTHDGVRYQQVWPGIDIDYHARAGQLQYDFLVAPGADASGIAMRFEGSPRLTIDARGDLLIEIDGATLRHQAPVAFQEIDGARRPVVSRFEIAGEDTVAVRVADYDSALPLVIDPSLVFSNKPVDSQLGGSLVATGISLMPDGAAFIVGAAGGTTGFAIRTEADGSWDVKTNGQVFLTFISGTSGTTVPGAVEVNPDNTDRHVFLCGRTTATDIPTRNPPQAAFGGGIDGFIMILNHALGLEFGSYIGGIGTDICTGVDHIGQHAVATGYTDSTTGFPTANAIDSTYGGGGDAWVARSGGSSWFFSTFLGGTGVDLGGAVTVDASDNIYVVGETTTASFPQIPSPATAPLGCGKGSTDAFVTKLTADGSSILASTCVGGTLVETATSVALDSTGDIYVAGGTNSNADFPTVGAVQDTYGGGDTDAFLFKLDAGFTSLEYSTYLGGSGDEGLIDPFGIFGMRVDVGPLDNAYVAGSTAVTSGPNDFPVVRALSVPPSPLGARDVFLSKLTPTGSSLMFSTLFGGSGSEVLNDLAVDAWGNARMVGSTGSEADFPMQQGPYAGIEDCTNGLDDDGNQLVDCDDADCSYPGGPCEICGNSIDDDINNVADCAEIPCHLDGQCSDGASGADLDAFYVSIGDDICADAGCPSDGNACTVDCNPATGACETSPLVCDDGLFCNGEETCNTVTGCVAGTPPVTNDGIACTADSCDETNDVVVHTTQDFLCDDGLFCNGAETCSAQTGCVAGTDPCTDAFACTTDGCNDVTDQCTFVPNNAACDDSNVCTADVCTVGVGCQYSPQAGPCDDGLFCNGADTCSGGTCTHAGDPCTGMGACIVCEETADICEDTDPDVDMICSPADVCPNEFNPDQLDTDCTDPNFFLNGGCANPALVPPNRAGCCDGGDVCDACPANSDNSRCDHTLSGGQSVGPAGGSFTLGGCISVDIPADALPAHTSISVSTGEDDPVNPATGQPYNNPIKLKGGVAAVHKIILLPEGTHFAQPVSLGFCWDDADDNGVVDRGVCTSTNNCTEVGTTTCDNNGACACGNCVGGGSLNENNLVLRRNGDTFDYAGFHGPPKRKCGDIEQQNPGICGPMAAVADCNDLPATGESAVANCCDQTGNVWPFQTCYFSELYFGSPAGSLIPGRGSPSTDCVHEWSVVNPFNEREIDSKGFPNFDQVCTDGDPTCDADMTADGTCTLRVGLCLNVEDGRLIDDEGGLLCQPPAGVVEWSIARPKPNSDKRPWEQAAAIALRDSIAALGGTVGGTRNETVSFAPAYAEADACGDMIQVKLPLRETTRGFKKNRMKVKVVATTADAGAAGKPQRDSDLLKLTCLPAQ